MSSWGSGPASSSSTRSAGSSLKRLATTPPPEPEPTTMTSYRAAITTLWREDDLGRLARIENPVGLFAVVELHTVADDGLRFQTTRLDQVEQRPHIGLNVAPAGAICERLAPHVQVRKVSRGVVGNTDRGDRPPTPYTGDGRTDAPEKAHRLDRAIDAEAAGGLLDRFDRFRLRGVDWNRAETLCELEAAVDHVDHEKTRRAKQMGGHDRHQSDRTRSDHGDGVARRYLRPLGREKACGQDVANEDCLFIAHAGRDGLQGVVGEWHHDVLGLATTKSAEILAIAKRRLLDALVEPATPAVVTVTARAEERGHHPIASLEASHLGSRVLDDAHELMAEHTALASWNSPVVDVKVGAADGAQSHPDQRFRRLADRRLGDIDDPHVGFARVSQSPHGRDSMPPLSLSPHATQGGCGGGDRRVERHRRGDGAGLRAPRITSCAWRQAPGSLECSCAEMPRERFARREHPAARCGAALRCNWVHNFSAPRPRAHRHPRQQRRSWVDGQVARDARGEGRRA